MLVRLPLLAAAALVAAWPLAGQESAPAASAELRAAVERCLAEREETEAARQIDAIVQRRDATAEAVLAALAASEVAITPEMTLNVPHRDQLLVTTIQAPAGAKPGLPVVFDVSNGAAAGWLRMDGAIVAFVKGYTPPEFSDEGRDGFLKVLRRVAHVAHGDAERLWMCGFSWAGHASYDVALHRPGILRGIVPMGGGPRRTWFRILPQARATRILAFCGEKDDPELVWNLREVGRLAPRLKLDYELTLDPSQGHTLPLRGIEGVARIVADTTGRAKENAGTLLADAALVESALLRVDGVDDNRVRVPDRVPVSASLSPDGQRRATIEAMAAKVAKLGWKIEEKKDETIVTLSPDGVTSATVFLRASRFSSGRKVTVRSGSKPVFSEPLVPDPKTMLLEARRTGDRLDPPLRLVSIKL